MKALYLIFCSFLVVYTSGCRDDALDELPGRYHGTLTINSNLLQVVAEVPAVQEKGPYQTLQFEIYQTLGSAKPERVFVQIADSFLTIQSPIIGNRECRLTLNDEKCGVDAASELTLKLCVAPAKISFTVVNKVTSQDLVSLQLVKDDNLPAPPKSDENSGTYNLDELVGRARFSNYAVSQDAERVFQAKQRIKIAIGNLLPHFNMKDLLAFVSGGPLGVVEAIGDLMPFIFPSNWYKLAETKELESATRKSFASLRGNEMQYVESLYYLVSRDRAIEKLMKESLVSENETHRIITKMEALGLLPPKSAEKYFLNILNLEQDLVQLDTLIQLEQAALAHGVALPASSGIKKILPIELPNLDVVINVNASHFINEVKARSFESATFDYLIAASKANASAHTWGFLDPNSSDVIGFGYASMLRVGESSERELVNKKQEALAIIEQKVVIAVTEYNNSLKSYKIAKTGLAMADDRLKRLKRQLEVGDDRINNEYFVQEMSEVSGLFLRSSAKHITANYALLMARSKMQRMMLEGFYQDLEMTVE